MGDIFAIKDQYMQRSQHERRTAYKCGGRYVTLNQIDTWLQAAGNAPSSSTSDPYTALSSKISLYNGDITALEIDAIVNAANERCLGGSGIDGAIHKAAGSHLYEECLTLNGCPMGEAKMTGGYDLPARYVIHTVGPRTEDPEALSNCYFNCLDLCRKNRLRTVAFCCISTGIYGYSERNACIVALNAVFSWLAAEKNLYQLDRIIFCVFTQEAKKAYSEKIPIILSHYASVLAKNPCWRSVSQGRQATLRQQTKTAGTQRQPQMTKTSANSAAAQQAHQASARFVAQQEFEQNQKQAAAAKQAQLRSLEALRRRRLVQQRVEQEQPADNAQCLSTASGQSTRQTLAKIRAEQEFEQASRQAEATKQAQLRSLEAHRRRELAQTELEQEQAVDRTSRSTSLDYPRAEDCQMLDRPAVPCAGSQNAQRRAKSCGQGIQSTNLYESDRPSAAVTRGRSADPWRNLWRNTDSGTFGFNRLEPGMSSWDEPNWDEPNLNTSLTRTITRRPGQPDRLKVGMSSWDEPNWDSPNINTSSTRTATLRRPGQPDHVVRHESKDPRVIQELWNNWQNQRSNFEDQYYF